MGIIKKITGLFFMLLGIGFVPLALLTLLPSDASKPNLLGYYGHCSFAPVSTIILSVLSPVFILLGLRMFKKPSQRMI